MKHYTEYTMATNRLKVEKKKEKKGKMKDGTKLRRFIFSSCLSTNLSNLYPRSFFFKNDYLKIVRFDPRPVAFLMANALMARKEARVSFMENTMSDKASINSLTPRHN